MAQSDFQKSWDAFAKSIGHLSDYSNFAIEPADIDYLKSIGAHKALIAAAKHNHTADEFNLAPNEEVRDYTPDWMFKNATVIGGDGCGNYAVWMDVSRMDSPVVFICHDPAEVTVLAKSPADFFENLLAFIPQYSANKGFNLLGAYLETWTPQITDKTGITHTSNPDLDIFDFNAAEVGESVPLDYRGKHTVIEEPTRIGVLTLGTESDDYIKKEKRRDRIWTVIALGTLGLIFAFFYAVKGESLLASTGMTFLSVLYISGILGLSLDYYYSWQEKKTTK